jgi:hypothetical protein
VLDQDGATEQRAGRRGAHSNDDVAEGVVGVAQEVQHLGDASQHRLGLAHVFLRYDRVFHHEVAVPLQERCEPRLQVIQYRQQLRHLGRPGRVLGKTSGADSSRSLLSAGTSFGGVGGRCAFFWCGRCGSLCRRRFRRALRTVVRVYGDFGRHRSKIDMSLIANNEKINYMEPDAASNSVF